jgi:hypothetical protein
LLSGVETVTTLSSAPAGREQILLSGDRRVVRPADPGPAAPSLDFCPVALLLGAVTVFSQIAATYGRGPLAGAWDAYREVQAELPRAVAEKFERWLAEVSTRLRRICTGASRSIGPGT